MLVDHDAMATIAVRDLARAKEFYGGKLGLEVRDDNPAVVTYRSGGTGLLVYRSQYAGTNQATVATWRVDDVDKIAAALRANGVTFEHYDVPDGVREGDVHVFGSLRTVWFKDPDGNILSILSIRS
ncbi:MAG: VOC family protein [Candidatus Eremiobacteraeota bacterium]|nr:VOC family protein [Candidatus Eremiobacteraeota bacterium]MBV9408444.1 VOC family protein [Candidatus Eremiobacteraeota bacterium]